MCFSCVSPSSLTCCFLLGRGVHNQVLEEDERGDEEKRVLTCGLTGVMGGALICSHSVSTVIIFVPYQQQAKGQQVMKLCVLTIAPWMEDGAEEQFKSYFYKDLIGRGRV